MWNTAKNQGEGKTDHAKDPPRQKQKKIEKLGLRSALLCEDRNRSTTIGRLLPPRKLPALFFFSLFFCPSNDFALSTRIDPESTPLHPDKTTCFYFLGGMLLIGLRSLAPGGEE